MISRKLSLIDTFYNKSHGMVQLAMHVSDRKNIPKIAEKLSKIVLGLNLKSNETSFIYEQRHNDPITIPRFSDMEAACTYMYENHTPNFNDTLAKVGINDDIIVLNIAHLCADGGYFINLVDALSHPDREEEEFNKLPANIETNFAKQIASDEYEESPYIFTDPNITRINAKKPVKQESKYAKHIRMQIPAEELKAYNKEGKKVKGLTEALWTSLVLSTSAFNGYADQAGMATCIDMRKYLPKEKRGWHVCNHYSSITPGAKVEEGMTVAQLGKRMRDDFDYRLNHGQHYTFLKSLVPPDGKKIPGVGLEVSSLGMFKVNDVIDDVFVKSCVCDEKCDPLVSHSSFSVVGNGRNTLHGMFRYKSSVIDRKTTEKIGKGVEFALKNVPLTATVGQSMQMIQEFQNKL